METPPKLFSPFLPMQILVIFLGVWIGYQIVALNEERHGAEAQMQQIIPQADAALAAKKRLLALAADVGQLAAKDANAAQIAREFDIRMQNGTQSEPASGTK
jgi:hypothetical protein